VEKIGNIANRILIWISWSKFAVSMTFNFASCSYYVEISKFCEKTIASRFVNLLFENSTKKLPE